MSSILTCWSSRAGWSIEISVLQLFFHRLYQRTSLRHQCGQCRYFICRFHRVPLVIHGFLHHQQKNRTCNQLVISAVQLHFTPHNPTDRSGLGRKGIHNGVSLDNAVVVKYRPIRLFCGKHGVTVLGEWKRESAICQGNLDCSAGVSPLHGHGYRLSCLVNIQGNCRNDVNHRSHLLLLPV